MKTFEKPVVEIEEVAIDDIITTSEDCIDDCIGYEECKREI